MGETIDGTVEGLIRIGIFVSVLLVMFVWERRSPARARTVSTMTRWVSALSLTAGNTVIIRLLFPVLGAAAAMSAADQQIGLLNLLQLPWIINVVVGLLLLDLVIYLQHRAFHVWKVLWRVHRMHHTDPDVDTISGVRFHPVEAVLSMLLKLLAIYLIGASALAVIIFEVLLNASSLFNHANVNIPASVDRWLRLIIVTPAMHRIHHSVAPDEYNRNFGFSFPWWDRLFGTYVAASAIPDGDLGLPIYRSQADQTLPALLRQPFRLPPG